MDEEPDYDISIDAGACSDVAVEPVLRSVVSAALRRHAIEYAVLEIDVVSDAQIAELNERFLGHIGPTDVLTFDLASDRETQVSAANDRVKVPLDGTKPLPTARIDGQIVISLDTAVREANQRGHSVAAELGLYVVHGVLHLLGFDDHEEASADQMHAMEDEVLSSVGLGPVYKSIGG